jgi:hypothetical protein
MFIEKLKSVEIECEKKSDAFIREHHDKYGKHWEAFEELYQHLYLVSCCHWGCHKKEHVFEYLGGKALTDIAVARRAMLQGYYDESLSLIRTVGEIANLLNLFWIDNQKIREWLDTNDRTRIRKFGPAAVRKKLAQSDWLVPFSNEHYKFLCETATHPTPKGKPNSYSNVHQPVLGCVFQEKGFELCFWNLLWCIAVVSGPIAKLAILEQSKAEKLVELTVPVFEIASEHLQIPNES